MKLVGLGLLLRRIIELTFLHSYTCACFRFWQGGVTQKYRKYTFHWPSNPENNELKSLYTIFSHHAHSTKLGKPWRIFCMLTTNHALASFFANLAARCIDDYSLMPAHAFWGIPMISSIVWCIIWAFPQVNYWCKSPWPDTYLLISRTFRSGSVRNPFGFRSGSVRALCSGSVRANFGPKFSEPKI